MNINKVCGCYAFISRKVQYLQMWRLDHIESADTATHIPSFTAPAYLVTRSYGGEILDLFSIKLLNQFTYLPETRAPGLFKQALAINVAVFAVSSTQAWVFELFSTLQSIRKRASGFLIWKVLFARGNEPEVHTGTRK